MANSSKSSTQANLSSRDYSEKRNFIRMRVDASMSFTLESSSEKYNGRCRNLSGAGIMLETSKKLTVGNRINITLPSERSELPNLEALAEVIRVQHNPNSHTFEVGLVIQNMR